MVASDTLPNLIYSKNVFADGASSQTPLGAYR